jgi:NAD(P)-dependent dehydrogenase (short-subunit alcohol dehydrogenase family)
MPSTVRRFQEQVAIVTGSGKGIGRAEALLLATEGARVVTNDIGHDDDGSMRAENVAAEIVAAGGESIASLADVSTFAGCSSLVESAVSAFGRLDIVVNNAGLRAANRIDLLTEDEFDLVIGSHLKATFGMIKHSIPIFMAQGRGVILNTGSEAGLGMPFNSAYAAAKEGIAGLTRTVAREFGGSGIRCNVIRPRAATTTKAPEFTENINRWASLTEKLGRYAIGERGRFSDGLTSTPEEVAVLAVWLCSEAAAQINGYDFQVAGNEIGLWNDPQLTRTAYSTGGWSLAELDEKAPMTIANGLRDRFAAAVAE